MPLSGIDLSNIDASVRPQDDLYQHVNGTWLKSTEIPGRPPPGGDVHGAAGRLRTRREGDHRGRGGPRARTPAASSGRSGTCTTASWTKPPWRPRGMDPIRSRLAEVFATESAADLVALAGRLFRADVGGLFYIYPAPDAGNPDRILLYTGQGGLGLPDESYYREEKFAPMVQAYRDHVQTMLRPRRGHRPGGRRRTGGGAGDRAGLPPLGQRHAAGPAEDLQPEDRRRGRGALPAPGHLVRRRRHRAGEACRTCREHPGFLRRGGVAAGVRTAVRLAGMAGHARHQRRRPVPVRRVRGCQLRLLRHHPQRHAAQQGPLEARGRRRRGRARARPSARSMLPGTSPKPTRRAWSRSWRT